jgi:Mrp family chromosome partitioning ATPase
MKKLITALKQEYDYVIIDTPPVLVVSDAVALASEVDGTVLICRHQKSYVADIAKTLNTLSFAKANVLGVVVNDYTAKAKKMSGAYKTYEYYE